MSEESVMSSSVRDITESTEAEGRGHQPRSGPARGGSDFWGGLLRALRARVFFGIARYARGFFWDCARSARGSFARAARDFHDFRTPDHVFSMKFDTHTNRSMPPLFGLKIVCEILMVCSHVHMAQALQPHNPIPMLARISRARYADSCCSRAIHRSLALDPAGLAQCPH